MTSVIFPGQGSQYVGMSKDFYDNFKLSKVILEEIQDHVKIDLQDILFEDSNNLLNITKYTQISIFAASILIYKILESETDINNKKINIMMGHSLGEYTALACSKKLDLGECSLILKKRGELMNNAVEPNKSGMAALIGKDCNYIQNIIDENNINLQIANDNSPMQVVLSGDINEINNNEEFFLKNNIKKYVKLNVSAAFHSEYMIDAQKSLSNQIDKLNFFHNEIKIISNFTANASNNNDEIKNSLQQQMSNKVRWTESVQKLEHLGENKIIEIGPNKVLSGLIKRISNNFDIKSINNISDLKNYE